MRRNRVPIALLAGLGVLLAGVAIVSGSAPGAWARASRVPRKAWRLIAAREGGCGVLGTLRDREIWASRLMTCKPRLIKVSVEGPFQLLETELGKFWYPAEVDSAWLRVELVEARWDVYALRSGMVRPGDIVLDCGAFVGAVTRAMLGAGASKVVAIEPQPIACECLRRNLRKEMDEGRVVLCEKGVWDQEGALALSLDPGNPASASVALNRKLATGLSVPVTTIDRLVAELGLERVDFIKMDIEGAEVRALRGAQNTLRRFKPRLAIAAYHRESDVAEILRTVLGTVSSYRVQGSWCYDTGEVIRPQVLLFR